MGRRRKKNQHETDDDVATRQAKEFDTPQTDVPVYVSADVQVHPEDSASQVSASNVSSSVKVKQAVLRAKANAMKEKHKLELEEQKLKQKRELLEVETEIAIAQAEMDANSDEYNDDEHEVVIPMLNETITNLNPLAEPFEAPVRRDSADAGIASSFKAMIAAMHLPQATMRPFKGDPLEYWPFVRAFHHVVDQVCDDDNAKLTRLLQFCEGPAKQAIQACSSMEPSSGYRRALELLKERFGHDYKISEAWIKKITENSPVKQACQLQQLADDLRSCEGTLRAIGCLAEVSTQQVIVKVMDRLPRYLQTRWVKYAGDLRERQHRNPTFLNVVEYVETAAKEANDPVYGKYVDAPPLRHNPGGQKETNTGSRGRSFNTMAVKTCSICGSGHPITACNDFKSLSVDDRCRIARTKGLCFNCLRRGHKVTDCRNQASCSVPGCGKRHSSFLHRTVSTTAATANPDAQQPSEASNSCVNDNGSHDTGAGTKTVTLPLVPVRVQSADGKQYVETLALLDSGSTTTFCTDRLVRALRLPYRSERLKLSTMGAPVSIVTTRAVDLNISSMDNRYSQQLNSVFTSPSLPVGAESRATASEIQLYPHLCCIEVQDDDMPDADLLIGQDHPELLIPLEVRRSKTDEKAPFATRTVLGWTIQGLIRTSEGPDAVVNFVKVTTNTELQTSVERFWKLEYDGCLTDDQKGMSVSDRRAMACMEESIQKVDGHYEIAIPFKHRPVDLPNNHTEAERRLQYLCKRLNRDQRLLERYRDGMEEMVTKGYASEVPEEEVNRNDGAVWYLPHHPVLNPNKPDKVRIVFDCAAQYKGTSLNDNVMQGPDLTNQLIGVLLRFRQEPVAIMADIEAMFHQVRVPCNDRDVLRYLWWPNGELIRQPQVYRMNVHLFGGTWSPSCSNFALRQTARDNQNDFSIDAVNTVWQNFYVDDCLKSVENEDKAMMLVKELSSLLGRGGFKLAKWTSTSRAVLASIPEEDRIKDIRTIDLNYEALPTERALGVSWNVESDCFVFTSSYKKAPLTRRGMLSTMCSIYDPAGYLSPFTLKAKLMVQELTRRKFDWDEPLPEEEQLSWQRWLDDLAHIEKIQIQRSLKNATTAEYEQFELHHFADASNSAYGAVTYLRAVSDGSCKLLIAKSRLAPLKTITIPRLELMAATLAVKLDMLVKRELELTVVRSIFWTDSSVVLQYIRNDHRRFHTFVANRVAVIRDASEPEQWRHVTSSQNPADDASRGLDARQLVLQSRWWNGPDYLSKSESNWPSERILFAISDDDVEVKKAKPDVKSFVIGCVNDIDNSCDKLFARRSSWIKLKKDVAWLNRFIVYLRWKQDRELYLPTGSLIVTELQSAELAILRYVQRQCFVEELEQLKARDRLLRGSKLYKLCPVLKPDGMMCVGGRLKNAQISQTAKQPVILPTHHHVVDLIIRHEHELNGHVGREHVLSLLRQKFWIVRGRSAVRGILSRCVICKRSSARPGEQRMSDLPVDRITTDKPPFSYVGVDLFGPFKVKRGRSEVKRYGCIFCCLVLRAIHIEIVHSLDTDSFLNAVMRFISRRGKPLEIRSDNGTNFKAGDKELRDGVRYWNQAHIVDHLGQRDIDWKFNPPAASHMGGAWERLIRSVRNVLSPLLQQQTLDDESLLTVVCQAEQIINTRPLTALSDDVSDLEAITPVHLLNLRQEPVLPPGVFLKTDCYVRRRWKQVQYISDVFWRRWTREYLPLLQARQKWCLARRNFRVGDIVLMTEETPRNLWPLARIINVHCGDDGLVRSAELKTRSTTVVRPITKLCLLESCDDVDVKI